MKNHDNFEMIISLMKELVPLRKNSPDAEKIRNSLLLELKKDIDANVDNWIVFPEDIPEYLQNSMTYKYLAVQRDFGSIKMWIIFRGNYEENDHYEECIIIPKSCYIYGYLVLDQDYESCFESSQHPEFVRFCDYLLTQKKLILDKWETNEFYKEERCVGGRINVEPIISERISEIIGQKFFTVITKELFGDLDYLNDNSKLELLQVTLKIIQRKTKRDYSNKVYGDSLFTFCEKWNATSSRKIKNTIKESLSIAIEGLQNKINLEEKRRVEAEAEERKRAAYAREIKESIKLLGRWKPSKDKKLKEYINSLTLEEFHDDVYYEILSWSERDKWIFEIIPDLTVRKLNAIKEFMCIKRLFLFSNFELYDQIYDFPADIYTLETKKCECL